MYGSVSSAFFLFGLSLLYGLTGTTRFDAISLVLKGSKNVQLVQIGLEGNIAGATAVLLLLVGFGFKIAAVPFHQWAPDAYEGAPAPVTAWIATGSKIASFIALMKVLLHVVISWSNIKDHPLSPGWLGLLAIMAAATMTYGNFAALGQKNFKRMLAYSSIAHAGYMLVGVLAAAVSAHKHIAAAAVIYYLVVYGFTNIAAFGVAGWLARQGAGRHRRLERPRVRISRRGGCHRLAHDVVDRHAPLGRVLRQVLHVRRGDERRRSRRLADALGLAGLPRPVQQRGLGILLRARADRHVSSTCSDPVARSCSTGDHHSIACRRARRPLLRSQCRPPDLPKPRNRSDSVVLDGGSDRADLARRGLAFRQPRRFRASLFKGDSTQGSDQESRRWRNSRQEIHCQTRLLTQSKTLPKTKRETTATSMAIINTYHKCLESPYLFEDKEAAIKIPGLLAKAGDRLEAAFNIKNTGQGDLADIGFLSYEAMFCCLRALVYAKGYREAGLRCLLLACEELYARQGTLEIDHLLIFQKAQGLKLPVNEALSGASAFVKKTLEVLRREQA